MPLHTFLSSHTHSSHPLFLFFLSLSVKNFSSFQRLLNLHGFRRSSATVRDAYFHPSFLQTERGLVKDIVRVYIPAPETGESAGSNGGKHPSCWMTHSLLNPLIPSLTHYSSQFLSRPLFPRPSLSPHYSPSLFTTPFLLVTPLTLSPSFTSFIFLPPSLPRSLFRCEPSPQDLSYTPTRIRVRRGSILHELSHASSAHVIAFCAVQRGVGSRNPRPTPYR